MEHGDGLALGFIPGFDGMGCRLCLDRATVVLEERLSLFRQLQ
jgi:hypothetical protein